MISKSDAAAKPRSNSAPTPSCLGASKYRFCLATGGGGGRETFLEKDIRFDASNIEIKGGFEGKKGTKALWFLLSHGFTCYAVKAN